MARSGERARACERRLRLLLASGPIAPVAMFKGNNVGGYLVIGGASYVVLQLGSRMPRLRVALP
jgi:hypothetical protein